MIYTEANIFLTATDVLLTLPRVLLAMGVWLGDPSAAGFDFLGRVGEAPSSHSSPSYLKATRLAEFLVLILLASVGELDASTGAEARLG